MTDLARPFAERRDLAHDSMRGFARRASNSAPFGGSGRATPLVARVEVAARFLDHVGDELRDLALAVGDVDGAVTARAAARSRQLDAPRARARPDRRAAIGV